jgi:hypothetical protein
MKNAGYVSYARESAVTDLATTNQAEMPWLASRCIPAGTGGMGQDMNEIQIQDAPDGHPVPTTHG